MGAILRTMTLRQAVVRCLQIGVDFVLICHTPKAMRKGFHAAQQLIGKGALSPESLQDSFQRIEHLRKFPGPPPAFSQRRFDAVGYDIRQFSEKVFTALPKSMRPIDARLGAIGEKY